MSSNGFSWRESVKRLRKEFPVGCRVGLATMSSPIIDANRCGTVSKINDDGCIFIDWDTAPAPQINFGEERLMRVLQQEQSVPNHTYQIGGELYVC